MDCENMVPELVQMLKFYFSLFAVRIVTPDRFIIPLSLLLFGQMIVIVVVIHDGVAAISEAPLLDR